MKPLRDEDAMVGTVGTAAGQRVHKHSLAVEQSPERFVPDVSEANLERADALLALETMVIYGDDGKPLRTLRAAS